MLIRALTEPDYEQWLPLWQAYLAFYATCLSENVSRNTWAKFQDPQQPLYAWGAFDEAGSLVGFVHTVVHPNTWNLTECCYLEDLFVAEHARRQAVARALIRQVYQDAGQHGYNRVYWMTHHSNVSAQQLYRQMAEETGMIQFRHNL